MLQKRRRFRAAAFCHSELVRAASVLQDSTGQPSQYYRPLQGNSPVSVLHSSVDALSSDREVVQSLAVPFGCGRRANHWSATAATNGHCRNTLPAHFRRPGVIIEPAAVSLSLCSNCARLSVANGRNRRNRLPKLNTKKGPNARSAQPSDLSPRHLLRHDDFDGQPRNCACSWRMTTGPSTVSLKAALRCSMRPWKRCPRPTRKSSRSSAVDWPNWLRPRGHIKAAQQGIDALGRTMTLAREAKEYFDVAAEGQ